jgi:hypothetical protein
MRPAILSAAIAVLLPSAAAWSLVPIGGVRAAATPSLTLKLSAADESSEEVSLFTGTVGEAQELLGLLDLWDEVEVDATQDACFLGPDDGCCMVGVEPLLELCEQFKKPAAVASLSKLFEQVLEESTKEWESSLMGEVGAPCVTVDAMRAALRTKVESCAAAA